MSTFDSTDSADAKLVRDTSTSSDEVWALYLYNDDALLRSYVTWALRTYWQVDEAEADLIVTTTEQHDRSVLFAGSKAQTVEHALAFGQFGVTVGAHHVEAPHGL